MRWMPRNVPLAVVLRLLLLTTTAVVILAIGMYKYDWQLGEKTTPATPQYEKNSVKLLTDEEESVSNPEEQIDVTREEQELADQLTDAILGNEEQDAVEKIKERQQYKPEATPTPSPADTIAKPTEASPPPLAPKKQEQKKELTEEEELQKLLEEAVTP